MMDKFEYSGERFADLQILRYRIKGFETLPLKTKCLVYCLAKATLYGRDITFDQFGKYNLKIRKILETIYEHYDGDKNVEDYTAMMEYLKRVWFSNGIYHHYGCDKFTPSFSQHFLIQQLEHISSKGVVLPVGIQEVKEILLPVMYSQDILPKRVNKNYGEDLVTTSACNYYENVTQKEAEDFYNEKKTGSDKEPSWGLNTHLVKHNGVISEVVCRYGGLYSAAIEKIIYWLEKALDYTDSDRQKKVIRLLVDYYKTGNLSTFDDYCIEWVNMHDSEVDFINGFIEVYGDPLGIKASWEGIVEILDKEASQRTKTISDNAQWFEDNSPIDRRFKKDVVKGVTARAVYAAMLGGDEYPSTAIGINLPNADWIRAEYGSKSVTITNITEAYSEASKGSGFRDEFVIDKPTMDLIDKWGHLTDDLHTDLHECLGHGSGKLLTGVSPDALKAYGNTIEEARADLFGLYFMADSKMTELNLLPSPEAFKAQYYTYMMNGLMTQLVRIEKGKCIEEAHMRNRALIAYWVMDNSDGVVEMVKRDGKTYVKINDYHALRTCFGKLLSEIQRIKSEGDLSAAREIVEKYAVNINPVLHNEILERYASLNIAPYKGFLNPHLLLVKDSDGNITDVVADYSESYSEQMMRYGKEYATLAPGTILSANERLKKIKRSFRLFMNGVTSSSMREKGVNYKINWGVQYNDLLVMANEYGKDIELASALWKEDIRECKILATLIMPAENMKADLAEMWMEQTPTQEIAEMLATNLLQYIDAAPQLCFRWIASDRSLYRICGFNILSKLLANGKEPDERGINECLDQINTALHDTDKSVAHAAYNCLNRFCELGMEYEMLAKQAIPDFC